MRIWSLLRAQALESRRNPLQLMVPVMVLVLTVIWRMMAETSGETTMFAGASLLMCSYMIGFQFPAITLAEEREKRTLESVLLTPARPIEILAARTLLTAALSLVTAAISLSLYKITPASIGLLGLGFVLSLSFSIAMGLTIGVMVPDQKTGGVIGSSIMVVLILGGILPWEKTWPAFWKVQAWLPTRPTFELVRAGLTGGEYPVLQDALVILTYVVVMVAICSRSMRRLASAK